MGNMHEYILSLCQSAKQASNSISAADGKQKNEALLAIADMLIKNKNLIISANKLDTDAAEQTV